MWKLYTIHVVSYMGLQRHQPGTREYDDVIHNRGSHGCMVGGLSY